MTEPTTAAGRALQRYSLTVEPDDSAYMELDPDGYYVIGDEAEAAIAESRAAGYEEASSRLVTPMEEAARRSEAVKQARAAALDEARAAVEAIESPGYYHPRTDRALAAIDALREDADKV